MSDFKGKGGTESSLMINWTKTERGFVVGEFSDLYGKECSIQESSLAEEDAIWLGVGENRMHLTTEMAKDLVRHLNYFIENGCLTETPETKPTSATKSFVGGNVIHEEDVQIEVATSGECSSLCYVHLGFIPDEKEKYHLILLKKDGKESDPE